MKTNFTNQLRNAWRTAVMALALISTLGVMEANAQTPSCYSCSDGSNVTLYDCAAIVTPSLFLGYNCDDPTPTENYVLTVSPDDGVIDNGTASVTITKPGTYTYTIEGDNNKCWATFNVDDKSGPECIVPDGDPKTDADYLDADDVSQEKGTKEDDLALEMIDCTDDPALWFDVLELDDFDDCTGVVDFYHTDEELHACSPQDKGPIGLEWDQLGTPRDYKNDQDYSQGFIDKSSDGFIICAIYKRTWFSIDGDGYVSEGCSQYVYAYRSTDDPTIPTPVELNCDDSDEDIAAAITPTIPKFGGGTTSLIVNEKVCKYIATVTYGEKLPTCGSGYKQINKWQVIDWCTQSVVAEEDQIVVVADNEKPSKPEAGDIIFAANPYDCNGTVIAGPASAKDNCSGSNLTWTTTFTQDGVPGEKVLNTNGGNFAGVAIGATVTVKWTAFDECGNMRMTKVEFIDTKDNRAPVAICNDELNVSLVSTNDGQQARVYGEDLDDTSKDNCGIVKMEVSRDGENYAEYATFDCSDLGEQTVYLRVMDAAGNSNICWTTVNIEDKTVPIVVPPADVTILCTEEIPPVGTPTVVSEGCQDPTVTYDGQEGGELICGEGEITRTWTVTPASNDAHTQGEPYEITQTITIEDAPYTWTMMFPKDIELTCTEDGSDPRPDRLVLDDFLVEDNGCQSWQMSFKEEEYFGTDPSSCYKIVRTYTFANWCAIQDRCGSISDRAIPINDRIDEDWKLDQSVKVKPFDSCDDDVTKSGYFTIGKYGKFVFTHVIKVNDESAPTLKITAVPDCDDEATDCNGGSISGTTAANDVCSNVTVTKIRLTDEHGELVDQIDNPETDEYEFENLATGTYTVSATAVDACGNVAVDSETVDVEGDCKAPTIVCHEGRVAVMENGRVMVWAQELYSSLSDNCTNEEDLLATLVIERAIDVEDDGLDTDDIGDAPDPASTDAVELDCEVTDYGFLPVVLWIQDKAGNWQYCVGAIEVQPGTSDPCGADVAASVAGKIVNEKDVEIDEVMIKFEGTNISPFAQMYSGFFNYSVPMHTDLTITPEKSKGYMNGISTGDLVKLQRHILGIASLSSAYELIAADATNDNKVDTRDMLHISRLILGLYDELPNSNSWRFVAKDHVFVDPTSPWGFPEAINYSDLTGDAQADFIGIKIGDLTGNASPSNLLGDATETAIGELNIAINDEVIEAGVNHTIEFTAEDFNDFAGYQFTISLDEAVTLTDLTPGALPNMTEANFGMNRLDQGIVTTSWANARGVSLDNGEVLFSITVKSDKTVNVSDILSINSEVTAAEAYSNTLDVYGVTAKFNKLASASFELFQNQPNPFDGETIIGFNMPGNGEATLRVMNVAGQVLTVRTAEFVKGYNQIILNKADLNATGVLYYSVETDSHSATKKMIILE